MPNPEREHPRYAHEAKVRFSSGTQQTNGRTRNLSRGGLCANVGEALPVGADVNVEITLVFDDKSNSEPLQLAARVVWCTPFDEGFQLGVAFRPMDDKRAQYLTLFLKFLGDETTAKPPRAQTVDERFG